MIFLTFLVLFVFLYNYAFNSVIFDSICVKIPRKGEYWVPVTVSNTVHCFSIHVKLCSENITDCIAFMKLYDLNFKNINNIVCMHHYIQWEVDLFHCFILVILKLVSLNINQDNKLINVFVHEKCLELFALFHCSF